MYRRRSRRATNPIECGTVVEHQTNIGEKVTHRRVRIELVSDRTQVHRSIDDLVIANALGKIIALLLTFAINGSYIGGHWMMKRNTGGMNVHL